VIGPALDYTRGVGDRLRWGLHNASWHVHCCYALNESADVPKRATPLRRWVRTRPQTRGVAVCRFAARLLRDPRGRAVRIAFGV
jgi:hypothetical protein